MTLEIREVEIKSDQINFDPDRTIRPTIIPWKGVPMIRSQAIGACIQEILHAVAVQGSQDVVNINIIGDPDTGKTETGKTIAHLIHKRAKIPFSVRSFTREDLLDFKKTLKTLRPANYVLLFPDVSFLSADASGKKLE